MGLIRKTTRMPEPVTAVRMAPSSTQLSSWMTSCSWNRKKETRLAITLELMFIAQNIPEFLVIVSSSEFLARMVPCQAKCRS